MTIYIEFTELSSDHGIWETNHVDNRYLVEALITKYNECCTTTLLNISGKVDPKAISGIYTIA